MNKKELPSVRDLEYSLRLLRILFLPIKALKFIGLRGDKMAALEGELLSIQSTLHTFTVPAQFNTYFSSRGWIAHDSMNFELMKDVVQKADIEGVESAEERLFDDYRPNVLQSRLVRLTVSPDGAVMTR